MKNKMNLNRGISLISLVITIVVILILAAITIVSSIDTVDTAGRASFASEIADFSEVVAKEYVIKKGQSVSDSKKKTDQELYYSVALGRDDSDVKVANKTANLTNIKPIKLKGTDIYEIKDDIKLKQLEESGQIIENQKYYVTDEGEVFIWPGYYVESEERWWVNGQKYYEGNKKAESIEKFGNGGSSEDNSGCVNHTWEAATCTLPRTCSKCGTTEGFANGHKWQEATCLAPKTCTVCGKTQGDVSSHSWRVATCILPRTCSVCGDTQGVAKGHIEVIDKEVEPTCTTPGKKQGSHCSVCNEVLVHQEEIPQLGHTEVIDKPNAVTCTEAGKTQGSHCSVCGAIITAQQEIPASGHTWVNANCTTPKTCSVCGAIDGSKLGHTEVIDEAKAVTCTEAGKTQGLHCSVCNEVLVAQEEIAALGHTWVDANCTTPKTCSKCGATEGSALGHTKIVDAVKAETCTESGLTEGWYCSVCEAVEEQEEIPALGHNFTGEYIVEIEATCIEPGRVYQACSRCECKGNIIEIPALGHTPNEEDGKSCIVCGAPLTPEEYVITYNLDGGTVAVSNPNTYTKYQVITLNNPTRPSYEFLGWTGSNGDTPEKTVTIPKWTTGAKEYTANWKISTANYTVKHWQQTLTGTTTQNDTNYSCVETQTSSEIIGSSVTPAVKTYSGFTAAQTAKTVTIAADGSTNIDYYYTRNSYTITANTGTGISAITGGETYKYGANVSISATLETGFGFNYWIIYYNQSNTSEYKYNQTESFTMPAENITVTAYGYDTRTAQALFFSSGQLRFIKDSTIYNAGSTYPDVGTVAACYTGWDTGTWDSSQAPYWAIDNGSQITTVYFEDKVSPKCTVNWFYNLTNCNTFTNIGTNLDMSNVVDTSYMFYNVAFNCTSISLDLSKWNMSSVKNMQYMFGAPEVNYSNSFTSSSKGTYSLNLSEWNLLSVKDMSYAFCNGFICGKTSSSDGVTEYNKSGTLTINVTDWKTNNVTNMESVFYRVGSVASSSTIQGLNTWNTGNVTNMKKMFSYMGGGTVNIGTLETWDVSSVQNMESMFDTFANDTTSLTSLNLASWDVSSVQTFKNMFMYHGVNISTWNFGDLSAWEPYNVSDMSYMFAGVATNPSTWTPPKIENWWDKVYNVTDMSYMFALAGSNASWSLNLSNWQVDSVTNYKSFDAYNEGKITLPSWSY